MVGQEQAARPRLEYGVAITLPGEDQPLGSVGLHRRAEAVAEIGWCLRRDLWGRGLTTEAAVCPPHDAGTVEELRGLLNVPEGKLARFADFNKYCLKVAKDEFNKLCPFFVDFTPIKKGRKVERVALHWFPKTSTGKRDAQILIDQHSVVRRAKLRGEPLEMPVLVEFGRPPDER